jgi:hypothetical protein
MEIKHKYWILFSILLIGLIWSVKNKENEDYQDYQEGFENEDDNIDTESEKVKLSTLLGLLLDNQNYANQIIIDYNLISVRDLVEKNVKNIELNLKPILRNDQFRIVTKYLLLNDVYFTGETQDINKIVTFSRDKNFVNPKEIFKTNISMEITELNNFRKSYHLRKMMYYNYSWISNKIKKFIKNYGLSMLTTSQENMKEIFEKNYWEGYKYLTKSNFFDYPINTVLYMKENNNLCIKIDANNWYISPINMEESITIFQRVIVNPNKNWEFWTNLFKSSKEPNANKILGNQMPSGNYLWIRSSCNFDIPRLYQKIDEMSQNNYFSDGINSVYDKIINLPTGLELVYTQLERMKLIKKWIQTLSTNKDEQKIILENIIIDLNQRVINMFDDIVCYLIFYQMEDFSELYLDSYIKLNDKIGNWWSASNFSSILINATNLGQCYLPATFTINQIQKTPPIFKFVYNKNLYHTFWDPLQIYLSDLEKFLTNKFKSQSIERIAPIARFCCFNNNSLREYLAKYITCTTDKCTTDLSYMKEPDRCGALKLKYQELLTKKMRFKCFYQGVSNTQSSATPTTSETNSNESDFNYGQKENKTQTIEEQQQNEQDNKINQMFGFGNLLLLNLIEYAIKYHKCQTESITIGTCQDLSDKIDTNDQKDDLKLGEVIVDRQTDLFNVYDQQIDEYNKILKEQEIKKIEPLNILANIKEKTNREQNKRIDIFNKSADDFYSIVNDLTNIGSRASLKNNKSGDTVESFDNQLDDNMDLSENTFQKYQARIQSQLKGITNDKNIGYLIQFKNIFYELIDILTKDGRIMTSGMIILVVAFGLYFIDISS